MPQNCKGCVAFDGDNCVVKNCYGVLSAIDAHFDTAQQRQKIYEAATKFFYGKEESSLEQNP